MGAVPHHPAPAAPAEGQLVGAVPHRFAPAAPAEALVPPFHRREGEGVGPTRADRPGPPAVPQTIPLVRPHDPERAAPLACNRRSHRGRSDPMGARFARRASGEVVKSPTPLSRRHGGGVGEEATPTTSAAEVGAKPPVPRIPVVAASTTSAAEVGAKPPVPRIPVAAASTTGETISASPSGLQTKTVAHRPRPPGAALHEARAAKASDPPFPRRVGGVGPARECVTELRRVQGDQHARLARPRHHRPRRRLPAIRSFESGSPVTRYPNQRSTTPSPIRARRNATAFAPSTRDRLPLVTPPTPQRARGWGNSPETTTGQNRPHVATSTPHATVPAARPDPKLVARRPRDRKTKTSTIYQVLADGPRPSTSRASLPSS